MFGEDYSERNFQMIRKIFLTLLIVALVLTLGIYNFLHSDRSLEWGQKEALYPLNKIQQTWLAKKEKLVHWGN